MKRAIDLFLALGASVFLALPLLCLAMLVKCTSRGPVLYWSDRVGRNNTIFKMPKFRSMRIDTPVVAMHMLPDPLRFLTPIGRILRITSMDELPQLWNILRGEMSFVGPRPALFNQDDLVALRTARGVDALTPITGWAQVNGRDELPIPEKVKLDRWYMRNRSFWLDLKIVGMTVFKVIRKEGVAH